MEKQLLIAQSIAEIVMPLSNNSLKRFASILIRNEVKKGALFLSQNEVSRQIGYVHKGLIRQFYYKNNKDLTEHFAYENQLFLCIESFLHQNPSHLMVEALENCIIYGIPYDGLLTLTEQDREIEIMYRTILEKSLILSQIKTDSFRFETANERYIRLMKEHPEIIQRAPLSHIASYLLMTPETLSRVRANII